MTGRAVLHICNDFLWTKVHRNLYAQLDQMGVRQQVFTPLRKHSNRDSNRIEFLVPGSAIRFSSVLGGHHRIFFGLKIGKLLRDLEALDIIGGCDIVHATTLFSDGALAWEIFRKYRKPYIVAIRNTDINIFLRFKPHLILLARKILDNAQRLVFISQSNHDNFFAHPLLRMHRHDYRAKALVINNGIDRLWLDNARTQRRQAASDILFMGQFDPNKNVLRLIRAFLQLQATRPHLRLRLVGANGSQQAAVRKAVAAHAGKIVWHGHMAPGQQLLDVVRCCDVFAMASHHETFGLVYVEALSQGLPVLYTRGQGIDGTFIQNVGAAVDPKSVAAIRRGLEHIIDNFSAFDTGKVAFERFGWPHIAQRYAGMYEAILSSPDEYR
ncbi:glycosyltransferase [Massilia cavernae]|uniref:Glycosyltransferase n=1 Tax=Massilia cavernae TaxID=2320864 RepID=A0A418XAH5_9BURK|nr:glycosyltransferase [Massilia cavernae]RJG09480.1 glycosyltransferase [Massilia cavernae]